MTFFMLSRRGSSIGRLVRRREGERGMAVVTALLVVAAVTVIAAGMMREQETFLRAVRNTQVRAQAQWVLDGGVNWARQVLRDDGRNNATTRLDGVWARPLIDTRLAGAGGMQGGTFTGRIEDEQGKFNLRSLVYNGALQASSLAQFRKLCRLVGVEDEVASRIAQRILIAQPPAAPEDGSAAPSPAAFALAPMPRGVDDLRDIEGVDDAVVAKLRSHVTVLPGVTLINVNTASAEVIAACVADLSLDQAKAMVAQRASGQWFLSNGDFINRLNMGDLARNSVRVGVTSYWFSLRGAARVDSATVLVHVLMARPEAGMPEVIWTREGA